MRWDGLVIAILGGDEREQEISRLAALTGAEVRAYGFPWPEGGIDGVSLAPEPLTAVGGAHYLLLPVPGMSADASIYAPAAPAPVVPDEQLLGALAPGAHVIVGAADAALRTAADVVGVTVHEYERDAELMHLRAPAIVEGALRVAIEQTEVTIHAAEVCVIGHGTIGSLLARTLRALGAHAHVAARNPVQRAAAHAAGLHAHRLEDLADLAPHLEMVFSTVPAPVLGRSVLERLPSGALVVDLAAPPGSVDLQAARELGHRAVWARGLGRRAPVTVGASQWLGIRRRIEATEEGR
jgi:dipicolinate synthase subunit A